MNQIIVEREFDIQVKDEILRKVKSCMIKPSLALIQVGDDTVHSFSIDEKSRAVSEIGMNFRFFQYAFDTSEREIMNKIVELNNDEYIDGIIVELPLPNGMSTKRIINCIDVSKDVLGLTDKSVARFYNNRKCFMPCTLMAIMKLFKENEIIIDGKHIMIIGEAQLIGKSLAHLLLKKDATVTICHSETKSLKDLISFADILIVASRVVITKEMIKKDTIVVDLGGINEDGKRESYITKDIEKHISLLIPAEKVISCSNTMLLKNILECYNTKNISKY